MKYSKIILSGVLTLSSLSSVDAFTSISSSRSNGPLNQVNSRFMGRTMTFQPSQVRNVKKNSRGNVSMFLESGGGILGIGTPELVSHAQTKLMDLNVHYNIPCIGFFLVHSSFRCLLSLILISNKDYYLACRILCAWTQRTFQVDKRNW